jgi:hypothetical protein
MSRTLPDGGVPTNNPVLIVNAPAASGSPVPTGYSVFGLAATNEDFAVGQRMCRRLGSAIDAAFNTQTGDSVVVGTLKTGRGDKGVTVLLTSITTGVK